jgi:hypothetical protein
VYTHIFIYRYIYIHKLLFEQESDQPAGTEVDTSTDGSTLPGRLNYIRSQVFAGVASSSSSSSSRSAVPVATPARARAQASDSQPELHEKERRAASGGEDDAGSSACVLSPTDTSAVPAAEPAQIPADAGSGRHEQQPTGSKEKQPAGAGGENDAVSSAPILSTTDSSAAPAAAEPAEIPADTGSWLHEKHPAEAVGEKDAMSSASASASAMPTIDSSAAPAAAETAEIPADKESLLHEKHPAEKVGEKDAMSSASASASAMPTIDSSAAPAAETADTGLHGQQPAGSGLQASSANPSRCVTLVDVPIKKKWFDLIVSGKKKTEFRANSSYWRARLLNKKVDQIRLVNGRVRGPGVPEATFWVKGIEVMPVKDIPTEEAPKRGTADFKEMFQGQSKVIAIRIGRQVNTECISAAPTNTQDLVMAMRHMVAARSSSSIAKLKTAFRFCGPVLSRAIEMASTASHGELWNSCLFLSTPLRTGSSFSGIGAFETALAFIESGKSLIDEASKLKLGSRKLFTAEHIRACDIDQNCRQTLRRLLPDSACVLKDVLESLPPQVKQEVIDIGDRNETPYDEWRELIWDQTALRHMSCATHGPLQRCPLRGVQVDFSGTPCPNYSRRSQINSTKPRGRSIHIYICIYTNTYTL